ncbi:MAG: glycosyltransferase [Planctomycetota bacterium]|nr:glycosyltransferase [Planctomycetota bacterium]MDG2142798.1 glycosyltransferase [Planctomycetota bacterium]
MTRGKIIHVTLGKANPNRANGINVIVHNLAESQPKVGLATEVWGLTPTPEEGSFERSYPLRLFERKSHRMGLSKQLKQAIAELPTDAIVHFHGGLLVEFYHMARRLQKRGIPWVLMPHGSYSEVALKRGRLKKHAFIKYFDRFVIENAAAIHAHAPGSMSGVTDLVTVPTTKLFPNGYTLPQAPFAAPQAGSFRFVYCGRIALYHKGLDLLAGAMDLLEHKGIALSLDIVGDGPDRAELTETLEQSGAARHVTFHGPLFGQEKRDALLEASCFLLTSRHEGFPMAVTEAVALGLPLLVTEGTNYGDYVRNWDCGIVIESATPEAIAQGMTEMASLSQERLAEMGSNAVRLVREELNWESVAHRMADELYAPILGTAA